MTEVSVILPTYNERDSIQSLVMEILSCLGDDTEVIVVDDASPDGTAEKARELSRGGRNVSVLKRRKKLGVASAISEGIRMAGGQIVAWMDADYSMPPQLLRKMTESLRCSDVAIGSRYTAAGRDSRNSMFRRIASRAVNAFAVLLLSGRLSHLLGRRVSEDVVLDYTSGFIAVRRSVCDELPIRGSGGEYCIEFLHHCRLKGFRTVEIPYECVPRRAGQSKIAPDMVAAVREGIRYCGTIVRLSLNRREKQI